MEPLATTGSLFDRFRRLWGVRHIRYWYLDWQIHRFAYAMGRVGLGMGHPNPSDLEWLRMIRDGEA